MPDARTLIRAAARALLPPEGLSVVEHAERHRHVSNPGGGYSGPWTRTIAPYTAEPMEALTSLDYTAVALVGPGQCGKTDVAECWLQYSVEADPASLLWYMQTEPGMQAFVKDRINPAIDRHEGMRDRLGPRPVDDSLGYKRFAGMAVEFLSANHSSLINKRAPRIVADEYDSYPGDLGDVRALLDVRRTTFGRESMLLLISHPDLALGTSPAGWKRGIMADYADSNRCTWWWPCPRCGAHSSPNPGASRFMALDYPADAPLDEARDATRLVCPVNGCLIEDAERRAMNAAGRWIGLGQEIDEDGRVTGERVRSDTAGYWIVGTMSPFVLGGIGALARARLKAEREMEQTGDDDTLRQVVVKQWGIPHGHPRRVGSVDAVTLAERADPTLIPGHVPEGVRFLTVSADVQANRFELLRRGWGVAGESWVLDVAQMVADPATDPDAWDRLLEALQRPVPLADGSGRFMHPRAVSMDLGGAAGVTGQAYEAWLRWQRAKKVRLYGRANGRDAWNVLPTQGAPTPNAARLTVVYPEDVRKDRRASALARGRVPVARFNPNLFKDDLAAQLARAEPGPWYVHFPRALCNPAGPPHPWFEQLVVERRTAGGAWHKPSAVSRNEAADLMVMTHVLARLHGLGRIAWDKPPPWAAEWDGNPLVRGLEPEPPPAADPASSGRPPPAQPEFSRDPVTLPPLTAPGGPTVTVALPSSKPSRAARMA